MMMRMTMKRSLMKNKNECHLLCNKMRVNQQVLERNPNNFLMSSPHGVLINKLRPSTMIQKSKQN
jgi:hypothetical protein